jgi:hypothetical protein
MFIAILVLSGIVIEVGEAIYEGESQIPAAALSCMHIVTAAHVISGICFAILSIFHIKKNWSVMKNHLKMKNARISKEVLFACALSAAVLFLAVLAGLLID